MYKKKSFKYYVFLEEINEIIRNNLLKFKNINVIIDIKNINKTSIEKALSIIKFCKNNEIPFFLMDNYQLCTKHKSNGIFLSSVNKQITKPLLLKKNFRIIGSAHNQSEYSLKLKQTIFWGNLTIAILSALPVLEIYYFFKPLNIDNSFQ